MIRRTALIATAALLAAGGAAAAETTVISDTSAATCAKASSQGLSDADSLRACDAAIENGGLDRHDLIATYVNRGNISMNRRDFAAAGADFDHAIKLDPDAGEAWMDRGAIEILEHRYRDGIADTTKGIELGVRDPAKAYFNRAVAYEGVNDEAAAYVDYQEAVVLRPDWDLPKHELLRFTVTRKTGSG